MTCLNIQTSLARLWMAVVVFHKDIHCYQSGVLISRRFVVKWVSHITTGSAVWCQLNTSLCYYCIFQRNGKRRVWFLTLHWAVLGKLYTCTCISILWLEIIDATHRLEYTDIYCMHWMNVLKQNQIRWVEYITPRSIPHVHYHFDPLRCRVV